MFFCYIRGSLPMQSLKATARTWPLLLDHPRTLQVLRMSTTTTAQAQGPYTAETYFRRVDHTANTAHENEDSYVLTLHTDAAHHEYITDLRKKYFPPHLNKLAAHVALFHALPGSQLQTVTSDIASITQQQAPFKITCTKPYALSKGVALNVIAPLAREIFLMLKERWQDFLSRQDLAFRPHYTIQNKVDPETVKRTLEEVMETFRGSDGTVDGLVLWRYDRGFWRHERDFKFGEDFRIRRREISAEQR